MKYSSSIITESLVKMVGFIGALIDEEIYRDRSYGRNSSCINYFIGGLPWLDGNWFEMVIGGQ